VDCSIRSLWSAVQLGVDQVLSRTTLRDLLGSEQQTQSSVKGLVQVGGTRSQQPLYNLSTPVGS